MNKFDSKVDDRPLGASSTDSRTCQHVKAEEWCGWALPLPAMGHMHSPVELAANNAQSSELQSGGSSPHASRHVGCKAAQIVACSHSSLQSDQGLADAVDSILENVFHSEPSSPSSSVRSSADDSSTAGRSVAAAVEEDRRVEVCGDVSAMDCGRTEPSGAPPSCQILASSEMCATGFQIGVPLGTCTAVCKQCGATFRESVL